MLVIKTDDLIQSNIRFLNRDIYLASVIKREIKTVLCFSVKIDYSKFFQKSGLTWCLDENFARLKNDQLKCIIWDVKDFNKTDLEMLEWAKKNDVFSIQITNLGLNQQPVDLTIDPSLSLKVPFKSEKKGLFGPEYLILHHKYRHFNRIRRFYSTKIKNVFLGLNENLDYRHLRKIIDFFFCRKYILKIHTTPQLKKSHKKILKQLYPSVRFVGVVESLARTFFEADIAIISSEDLAYKAASCGTPCFYICLNKNQEFFANTLEEHGLGFKIQNPADLMNPDFIQKLMSLSVEKRREMGKLGRDLVDAKGIYRIIDFLKKMDII